MRDYGKVYSTFWSSTTTHSLSDDGKLLALYLMTCSHNTIAGVFRLPDGYVSEDMGWDNTRVQEGFLELLSKGFANRCATTKWVWVVKHLEWNKPENPNQRKSAAKIAQSVPVDCAWKVDFIQECGVELGITPTAQPNPSATVAQRLLNQEQEQEQEQPSCPPSAGAELPGFAEFWKTWPASDRKGGKTKCLETWKKSGCEKVVPQILAHVGKLKSSDEWRKQAGQFIPAPLVYLNGRRWDGAETAATAPAESAHGVYV